MISSLSMQTFSGTAVTLQQLHSIFEEEHTKDNQSQTLSSKIRPNLVTTCDSKSYEHAVATQTYLHFTSYHHHLVKLMSHLNKPAILHWLFKRNIDHNMLQIFSQFHLINRVQRYNCSLRLRQITKPHDLLLYKAQLGWY